MSLGDAIRDAIELRKKLKAQGVGNLDATFEAAVRAIWPFTREWHYYCDVCRDVGLEILACPGGDGQGAQAFCGRRKQHVAHEFGRPCRCQKGEAFRDKPKAPADFAEAGKVSKPSRFGAR